MVGYAASPTYTVYVGVTLKFDSIQGQGQHHGAFELPTISEAVHAGGDDRSPLAGLSGVTGKCSATCANCVTAYQNIHFSCLLFFIYHVGITLVAFVLE